ncbi:MAG: helix-turn-helix domain-containing protein [Bacteroidales bacterium]|nr:helix-turn-helix domain-containing protein [Bacteroidales bacterium]
MSFKKIIILSFLISCLCRTAAAEELRVFTNITDRYHLDGAVASGICQDTTGRIWFSTRLGFTVYDGAGFTRLTGKGNYYTGIVCDRFNRIWGLDLAGGLSRTDRSGRRIDPVPSCPEVVKDIFRTPEGHVFIVDGSNSVFQIQFNTQGEVTGAVPFLSTAEGTVIYGITGDGYGNVWTMTSSGLYQDISKVSELPVFCATPVRDGMAFGSSEGRVLYWTEEGMRMRSIPDNGDVTSILALPISGDLLAISDGSRISVTRRRDSRSVSFDSYQSGPLQIHRSPGGQVWIYSENGGLTEFLPRTLRTKAFYDSSTQSGWDEEKNIRSIFSDSQGHLWFNSSTGSLVKVTFYDSPFSILSLSSDPSYGNSPRSFLKMQDGSFIVGTIDGWGYVLDKDFNTTYSRQFSLQIHTMIQTHDGSLWIGTDGGGLFEFSSGKERDYANLSNSVKRYQRDPDEFYGINCNHIHHLCENMADHRLWIASSDGGISYVDLNTTERDFINKNNRLIFPTEVSNVLRHVTIGPNGWLYAGGILGLFVCPNPTDEPESIRFNQVETLANNDVKSVFFTSDGNMYACASGKGLLCFGTAYEGNRFKTLTKADGLLSDFVLAAVEDKKGDIWVASEAGLNRYRPSDGTIRSFIFSDKGDYATFNEGMGFCDADGTVYFSTSRGLLHFNPDKVKESGFVPKLLAKVSVSGAAAEPDGDGYIKGRPGDKVRVNFVAVDLENPERIRYSYRLLGGSGEWTDTGSTGSVELSLDKPGRYTLQIRSTNSEGAICDNVRSFRFRISYPARNVILQLAAVLAFLLVIAATILGFVRMRRLRRASLAEAADSPGDGMTDEDRAFTGKLNAYLQEHMDDSAIDVQAMVSHMNMGRSAFYDKVRDTYGKTPTELLKELRFDKAAELLKSGGYTVSQVAYMTGFNDSRYFSTVFKSRFGMTPTQYRKEFGIKDSRTRDNG